ncbi:PilX N-terminal domain-containing pilus assembly protein [Uliginosibacterium sp. 31-16]|uniref:pilus assembly PilX family protein n=1 Tax=Uliginosibacterium sp. 31-16 TaxID=3068315 RepID=UPI00273EF8C1|nr:PilX N-terminal domain-containing pilus assembly protein [Uliginosibacterium sp. 31-16]MDP5240741.1 PilX N-terminal domain-containing pilus assembly protein [Uliginosibacterium sp. 31-16]
MKQLTKKHRMNAAEQRGAALVVALIMLIMVSLLAAASFALTTSEARGSAGWSDRQRALFAAEGVLKEGETAVQVLVDAAGTSVEQAVRIKGKGFYVRTDGTLPDIDPWPTASSIAGTAADQRLDGQLNYIAVFEGTGIKPGAALGNAAGNPNKAAEQPRFTVYAKAGGIKEGTYVVLSSSKAY